MTISMSRPRRQGGMEAQKRVPRRQGGMEAQKRVREDVELIQADKHCDHHQSDADINADSFSLTGSPAAAVAINV